MEPFAVSTRTRTELLPIMLTYPNITESDLPKSKNITDYPCDYVWLDFKCISNKSDITLQRNILRQKYIWSQGNYVKCKQ